MMHLKMALSENRWFNSELGRYAGEAIGYPIQYSWASLVAQLVKNLPTMWETWVRSLGWEDALEKRTAYPLQYSDLENAMDYTVLGILQARILEWVAVFLLQGIFPTQGLNPGLSHCRQILYQLSHQGTAAHYMGYARM